MLTFAQEFAALTGACRFTQPTSRTFRNASTDAMDERLNAIVELIDENGVVEARDVVEEFGVSLSTAHANLDRLAKSDRITKVSKHKCVTRYFRKDHHEKEA